MHIWMHPPSNLREPFLSVSSVGIQVFCEKCRFPSNEKWHLVFNQNWIYSRFERFKQCLWSVARYLNANEFVQFHSRAPPFFSEILIKICEVFAERVFILCECSNEIYPAKGPVNMHSRQYNNTSIQGS